MASRAQVRGALDFGGMRRYRTTDALRRRLVYDELDREVSRDAYKAAYERLSWLIPVATKRKDVAKSATDMYQLYLNLLAGQEPGAKSSSGENYKEMWEEAFGMKIGSPEFQEWDRRLRLQLAMKEKGKKVVL